MTKVGICWGAYSPTVAAIRTICQSRRVLSWGGTVITEFLPDEMRLLTPIQTPAIHTAQSALNEGEIRRRYGAVDFTGWYCADGNRPTDTVERMINGVRFLTAFYQRAITDESAVVMWCE